MKIINPDLIYSSTSVITIGYSLARKYLVPHVWHIRKFGDLDYNFSYFPNRETLIRNIIKGAVLDKIPNYT